MSALEFFAWLVVFFLWLVGVGKTARAVAALVALTVLLLAYFTTAFRSRRS